MISGKELATFAQAALEEIEKCTSCGLCKDVCPVFALSKREAESPRGKISLLRALLTDEVGSTAEGVDIFNRCLLCYACQDACPAGVRTERLWIAGREMLAEDVGRPLTKGFFLRRILPYPGRFEAAVRLGRKLPGDDDTIRWKEHLLPRPSENRLDRLLPEVLEPRGDPIGTVALFPGCLLTEIFPYIGVKAAELLAFIGYRVITPKKRSCCGAPAFNNGDFDTGRKLAQRNVELFSHMDVEAIVSPDATCGGAFHHEYETLFPAGSKWRQSYLQVREKVLDFGEFLKKALTDRTDLAFKPEHKLVTVHDSCHLHHLQHKSDLPRQLLSLVPGLKLVESPHGELCCGFGGSYAFLFPGESQAIAKRKLGYLQSSHSQIIAVGSPGCLWRLRSEAAESALNVRVVHYLEILWDSLIGSTPGGHFEETGISNQQKLFDETRE